MSGPEFRDDLFALLRETELDARELGDHAGADLLGLVTDQWEAGLIAQVRLAAHAIIKRGDPRTARLIEVRLDRWEAMGLAAEAAAERASSLQHEGPRDLTIRDVAETLLQRAREDGCVAAPALLARVITELDGVYLRSLRRVAEHLRELDVDGAMSETIDRVVDQVVDDTVDHAWRDLVGRLTADPG